jgi:alpha-beta hydrolase superfamily lysophospholipase
MSPGGEWADDILGPDYQVRTLALRPDDEGDVVASLVRYAPPAPEPVRPSRAILYVHGWSDYFFQTGLAEYWHARGAAFYALDLRKYGRSLRPGQTPGYVDDLDTYDEELEASLDVITTDLGARARVMVMGHSTGGLVAALWAHRHPAEHSGLVLNSPWLELQGSSVLRHVSTPAIARIARFQPKAPLPNIDPGYYARTLSSASGGEWTYDTVWRPTPSFPVRAGWLQAVMAGHARVARGLTIEQPILVLASSRTVISPRWTEDMRHADVVLDVELVARRAVQLGTHVTVVRIRDGVHDLTLSPQPVRRRLYAEIDRWSAAYGWS